jgi:hypothetical protein
VHEKPGAKAKPMAFLAPQHGLIPPVGQFAVLLFYLSFQHVLKHMQLLLYILAPILKTTISMLNREILGHRVKTFSPTAELQQRCTIQPFYADSTGHVACGAERSNQTIPRPAQGNGVLSRGPHLVSRRTARTAARLILYPSA